ncbi:MAG: nucleotidyltransferase family protein [Actinomycetota bacterium]|nr:nucleotidyltransferase family protein [Actinomycetota bacterium]
MDLTQFFVSPQSTIRQVIQCIDGNAKGIAMIVDRDQKLIDTITDGDIRRAILANVDVDLPVKALFGHREPAASPNPVTAPAGTSDPRLLHIMTERSVRQIPLVDETGRVVDIAFLSDLVKDYEQPLTAVVMAGGFGTRLRPLTDDLPKPMLPVGDKPLLQLIIEQLHEAGINKVNLTTHYKREVIEEHFGTGADFGVDISYVEEDQPLGTAGSLSLLEKTDGPVLVINGDVLTRINFRAMLEFHRDHEADMTVAVRQYKFRVPYGVIETDGPMITALSEKPVVRHFINAGIYLLNPDVCRSIPNGQSYDMTDLISRLMAEGRRVVGFPLREYWLDIGQVEDYQRALSDIENGEV